MVPFINQLFDLDVLDIRFPCGIAGIIPDSTRIASIGVDFNTHQVSSYSYFGVLQWFNVSIRHPGLLNRDQLLEVHTQVQLNAQFKLNCFHSTNRSRRACQTLDPIHKLFLLFFPFHVLLHLFVSLLPLIISALATQLDPDSEESACCDVASVASNYLLLD
ncbi:hypothetical protein TRICI_006436 [Trichomonascus ciferrii]|uniref:Uncharacterized protein n=1 Tax=Trichomonascus ciferrii TaxID=44093 RepID=A0A642UHA6_9ASCO|nr:hypothetical protein TRICI_006436 [Trichomonascus ciferrii]